MLITSRWQGSLALFTNKSAQLQPTSHISEGKANPLAACATEAEIIAENETENCAILTERYCKTFLISINWFLDKCWVK